MTWKDGVKAMNKTKEVLYNFPVMAQYYSTELG
jgi:hypothetical protein